MKSCVNCRQPLKTPIDEFGDGDAPLCSYCWLERVMKAPLISIMDFIQVQTEEDIFDADFRKRLHTHHE